MSTSAIAGAERKRCGTRVRAQIPLRVRAIDPGNTFSERCHTLSVNPQGCGVRCSRPVEPGVQVRLDELPGGSSVKAHVASSLPLVEGKYWLVGICLEKPANLWCLAPTPKDWGRYSSVPKFFPVS